MKIEVGVHRSCVPLQGRQARVAALSFESRHGRLANVHLLGQIGLLDAKGAAATDQGVDDGVSRSGILVRSLDTRTLKALGAKLIELGSRRHGRHLRLPMRLRMQRDGVVR
jgi:hypothetical protein